MMDVLSKEAKRLEAGIARAASAGDKATMDKLNRELKTVKRSMDELRTQSANVEDVLRRLDTASPRELRRTLATLRRQLDGMERGTRAWDEHSARIRHVKAELDRVNSSLREQMGLWGNLKNSIASTLSSMAGFSLSLAGAGMVVDKTTQAYMDMDSEMADVRKYTGMTAQEVEELNEEFKNMDTATSREQLNRLAQEAGRLGKNSKEDVIGFVKAANEVNVALDDLGDGATLTLSKLTGIFGEEAKHGTEESLLKVGSVINELSQSCSASAPYIADFAARMGGVGAQAHMSIDQIMAFGAALDTQNIRVEAASTALAQIITRIYQDPANYAEVAGLQVEHFAELVRTDMNAALMELLEALSKVGGMNKLAPMFSDMGEKGSRAIATLSSLAGHLDEVRSMQQLANQAYEEGTSVSKEAAVQEEKALSQWEKQKKAIHENIVALGQRLYPMMLNTLKGVNSLIDAVKEIAGWLMNHKAEIIALAGAYALYLVQINYAVIKTKALTAAKATGAAVTKGWAVVVGSAKVAVAALNVVVGLLTGGIKGARTAMKAFNVAVKANPLGAFISLATTAVAVIRLFKEKSREAAEAQKEQAKAEAEAAAERKKQHEEWKASLTDIGQKSAEFCKEEITRLDMLYKAATDEARSKEERRKAAQQLQNLYPDYFRNMSLENIMVGEAATAYENLREKILEAARAKAIMAKIEENQGQLIELEIEEKTLRKKIKKQKKDSPIEAFKKGEKVDLRPEEPGKVKIKTLEEVEEEMERKKIPSKLAANLTRQDEIKEAINTLADMQDEGKNPIVIPTKTDKEDTDKGKGSDKTVDKFAAEKEWREKQEALNTIAYRSGVKDYEEYTSRMDAIAVEFYDRQLKHTDLGETERLKIQAQYHEAVAKQDQNARKATLDTLEQEYAEQGRLLKQNYIDGLISKETYELKTQEAEMEHHRRLSQCMEIGEKERLAAQDKYNDLLISNREKTYQKWLESVKRLAKEMKEKQAELDKVKQEVFGLNQTERDAAYAADLTRLDSVYASEMKAAEGNAAEKLRIEKAYLEAVRKLREKYMQDPQTADGFRKSIEKTKEWLDSEGGKALTGSLGVVVSGMSSVFSQLTSSMQADLELQTAAISRRYDAEISRAEGNAYKVAQLEKRKEAEIAAAKNEANRKMFAMQVIQAVAQTAQNAINAYGSAAAIPFVGHIMAPIAASMAVAAGMLQVAAIKKQAQASEAQGYAEGGFTRPGRKDEPAGIVHAGEWVAPQALVRSPQTRPLIDALEQARLGNTRPAIRAMDVSRAVTAPMVLAAAAPQPASTPLAARETTTSRDSDTGLQKTLSRLADRLERPFITVNSVTGETGMQKAQRDYDRLMANKSPKKR